MNITPINRSRIVLLTFFICDHAIWYYGNHFSQVSMWYVVPSEAIRIVSAIGVLLSFFYKNIIDKIILTVMGYCTFMFFANFHAASSYGLYQKDVLLPNILLFKKHPNVPVGGAMIATFFYSQFILFFFCSKIH